MRPFVSITLALLGMVSAFGVPDTINIQGSLSDASGNPLVGTRAYRVQFFDSVEGGISLGAAINDVVTLSAAGRFSIDLTPPPQVFEAPDVFYSLGIDSADPPDGTVDTEDVFPNRVKVNSVLFAHEANRAATAETAGHALTADTAGVAENATTALGLSGPLEAPGDRILLGNDVFLQVGPDGEVELVASGRRLRLAGQKWIAPRTLSDNISPTGPVQSSPQVAINAKGETVIARVMFDGMRDRIFRSHFTNGFWTDPIDLTDNISPNAQIAKDPVVAVSDNGDALICWRHFDNSIHRIFRSEYRNGLWTDPTGISDFISPDGQDASPPRIAVNASGEALIVWEESDGTNLQIFRSEYRNGAWTDPASLADNISPDGQNASNARVALNDAGEAVIVWEQSDGSNSQIFRSEYRNGAWIDPAGLTDNLSPEGGASTPRVALNSAGEAVIVWTQIANDSMRVFRSEYRNGAWDDPDDLSDYISPDGQPSNDAQVAIADNGDAVIVWTQSDGMHSQIFLSEHRSGAWTDPADLLDNISPDGSVAQNPQVRMNAEGETLIVWVQSDTANNQLFRSEYRNGAWDDPSDLNDHFSPGGGQVLEFQPALNDIGESVVAWQQFNGSRNQIFRSEYRGGAWIDPASLSDNISPNQTPADPPQMALGENGDTVIVWRQNNNANFQMYRSEFRFGF